MHLDANTNVDKDSAWKKQRAEAKLISKSVAGLGAGHLGTNLGNTETSCLFGMQERRGHCYHTVLDFVRISTIERMVRRFLANVLQ